MTQQVIYRYLGTNGILETPIHLEGIYSVKLVHLVADSGKILSNGKTKIGSVTVPESEAESWTELDERN